MNPESFDAFHTIAEIAVAMLGVTGLVLALGHKDFRFPKVAILSIFGTTMSAIIFAFVPEILSRPLGEVAAWRISAGLFGLVHLGLLVNHQARQLQFRKNTPLQLAITLASLPVIGLKLAVGLGFLLPYAQEIYLLGLLWCAGIPAYIFLMLMMDYLDSRH